MKLVWNNPSPIRTDRHPQAWEVIGRDGTTRVISGHEIQAISDGKLVHGENLLSSLQALPASYLCF
jgi:hypothetical protein